MHPLFQTMKPIVLKSLLPEAPEIYALYYYRGVGSGGVQTPPLKNNVKGFNPKYKLYLESGVKVTENALYFTKN